MSDIRVELIRDLGPSRQRGEGALHTQPNPREAEREQWAGSRGWARAASDGVCPARSSGEQRPAHHRTAQKRAAKEQGRRRARGQARSREGGDGRGQALLAQSRLLRTLRYEVPQHARYRRRRQAHAPLARASRTAPRRACRVLPFAAGKGRPAGAQAAPPVTPPGPC